MLGDQAGFDMIELGL